MSRIMEGGAVCGLAGSPYFTPLKTLTPALSQGAKGRRSKTSLKKQPRLRVFTRSRFVGLWLDLRQDGVAGRLARSGVLLHVPCGDLGHPGNVGPSVGIFTKGL